MLSCIYYTECGLTAICLWHCWRRQQQRLPRPRQRLQWLQWEYIAKRFYVTSFLQSEPVELIIELTAYWSVFRMCDYRFLFFFFSTIRSSGALASQQEIFFIHHRYEQCVKILTEIFYSIASLFFFRYKSNWKSFNLLQLNCYIVAVIFCLNFIFVRLAG